MSHDTLRSDRHPAPGPPGSPLWSGMVGFASIMMVLLGGFHVLGGLAALLEERFYEVSSSDLLVSVDYTWWGIAHVVLGATAAMAGIALFYRRTWGRIVAIVVASFSAVTNLAFLSAAPWWYAIMILLDVLVIYAVTVHFDDEHD